MNTETIQVLLRDLFIPYFVICAVFYLFMSSGIYNLSISPGKVVLFVIAHPDDECIFFSPTISSLVQNGNTIHLLCLSTGNFYDKGHLRKPELLKSCGILGIPESHVTTIEHGSLQDDPKLNWDVKDCGGVIVEHVNSIKPDLIFSFDDLGVSGHLNHRSVYSSLQCLYQEDRLPTDIDVFCLESVSFSRQYLTLLLLDLPYSFLSADLTTVAPWRQFFKGQKACLSHWSQMEWFRILHLSFSRYMLVNSFHKMKKNKFS